MTPTTPTPNKAPITKEDVLQALGDTDPNKTNASSLLRLIGRGSQTTIQKHLDAIRAERAPALPVASGSIPAAPSEVLTALWNAAWLYAQVQTLGRLDEVSAQRDAGATKLATIEQDLAASLAEAESLTEQLAQATAAAVGQEQAQATELQGLQATNALLTVQLAEARAETESTRLAAANVASIAERDAQLLTKQHAANTEHLMSQVLELRELLAKHLAPPAAVQPVKQE